MAYLPTGPKKLSQTTRSKIREHRQTDYLILPIDKPYNIIELRRESNKALRDVHVAISPGNC